MPARSAELDRVWLGTWGMSGAFGPVSDRQSVELITLAYNLGIRQLDTAAAYGQGAVERLIGKVAAPDFTVLTKVPAMRDNSGRTSPDPEASYPSPHVTQQITASLRNLRRDVLQVVLLHNWSDTWRAPNVAIDQLHRLKAAGAVERIGISLPNHFAGTLHPDLMSMIDVLEAPLNASNQWIRQFVDVAMSHDVEIILRSLFNSGLALKDAAEIANLRATDHRIGLAANLGGTIQSTHADILDGAMELGTSIVFGCSTSVQLRQNVQALVGGRT